MSYADRLRRELLLAGIDRHELHHETATTLPVDFHSTRRAYATALVRSGASDRETMKLGGWSSPQLITRYDEKDALRVLPASAVPLLPLHSGFSPNVGAEPANDLFCEGPESLDSPGFSWCRSPDLNRGQRAYEGGRWCAPQPKSAVSRPACPVMDATLPPGTEHEGQNAGGETLGYRFSAHTPRVRRFVAYLGTVSRRLMVAPPGAVLKVQSLPPGLLALRRQGS
jgi:hypothetical protein